MFLADLIGAAIQEAEGKPFAVVNSDILLAPAFDLEEMVAKLQPGASLISRRIDIDGPNERLGEAYWHGFDFIAMNPINPTPDLGMVFGMPWWDHFLPIVAIDRGHTLQIRVPFAFHVKHNATWDERFWGFFGHKLLNGIDLLGNRYVRFVRARLFRQRICFWNEPRTLQHFSNANVAYIDEHS